MSERLRYKIERQGARWQSSWSFREKIVIRLWACAWFLLARWTPKCFNGWRVLLLRLFGATLHGCPFVFSSARIYAPFNVVFYQSACIGPYCTVYSLGKVILHTRCVISQEAFLCGGTHDFCNRRFPLVIGDISVGEDAFIGARAFIMPGVIIGKQAVVGAMSVVTKDVPSHAIVVGNPARQKGERFIRED